MTSNTNLQKKLLLVDDDEMHLSIAELYLKGEFGIFKAKSGSEALKCLCNGQFVPDLILLDIIMPEMDGWEVFSKIKGIALLKNTPIVFFTSVDDESSKKKAYELGAVDYITKPFKMISMLDKVKDILSAHSK